MPAVLSAAGVLAVQKAGAGQAGWHTSNPCMAVRQPLIQRSFQKEFLSCAAGVLAVQKAGAGQAGWRVSATGVVTGIEAAPAVVKKLKLVGHPFKVQQHNPHGLL